MATVRTASATLDTQFVVTGVSREGRELRSLSDETHGSSSLVDFTVETRQLDGYMLLAAGGSSRPEDITTANLSSLEISRVVCDDLKYFVNLDELNLSDNSLSSQDVFDDLSCLPRLSLLLLSCNQLSNIAVSNDLAVKMSRGLRFAVLETLDLSFNELQGECLVPLSYLPSLKRLDVSRNCISSVPPGLRFDRLEDLNLASNDLVQFDQWRTIEQLPKLSRLSLAHNRIRFLSDDSQSRPVTAESDQDESFPSLAEIDLSNNEIASLDSLAAVVVMTGLKRVLLIENPIAKTMHWRPVTENGVRFLFVAEKTKKNEFRFVPKFDNKKLQKITEHTTLRLPLIGPEAISQYETARIESIVASTSIMETSEVLARVSPRNLEEDDESVMGDGNRSFMREYPFELSQEAMTIIEKFNSGKIKFDGPVTRRRPSVDEDDYNRVRRQNNKRSSLGFKASRKKRLTELKEIARQPSPVGTSRPRSRASSAKSSRGSRRQGDVYSQVQHKYNAKQLQDRRMVTMAMLALREAMDGKEGPVALELD